MNWNGSGVDNLHRILMGTATVAVLTLTIPAVVQAKSSSDIYQIAQQSSVQINADLAGALGGSGVIIGKQGNVYTVLTAHHVACLLNCRQNINYTVRTPDGRDYPVTQVRSLPNNSENNPDIAVVHFETNTSYPVATLGDSRTIVPGSSIYVFGYPALVNRVGTQRESEFTPGMVTSRPSSRPQGYNLRHTAITKSGMSGGPVFDSEGRVVGIHGQGDTEGQLETSTGSPLTIKTGFNAAIPIEIFVAIGSQLGVSSSNLQVNNSPNQEKPAQLDNPSAARDYNLRGMVRLDGGNYTAAIADFTLALERNPDPDDAHNAYFNRGNARIRNGDRPGAIADWTEAIKSKPNDARPYYNRGLAYDQMGNWQEALADTNQAIQLDPTNEKAYLVRGNAKAELGDPTGALADYNRAIEINPNYPLAYNNRATILVNQGDRPGALEDLRRSAELLQAQGKMSQYRQVQENIRVLEHALSQQPTPRPANNLSTPSGDTNLAKLAEWGLDPVNCGAQVVSILMDGKEYCTQPTDWLSIGSYKYLTAEDRLEPISVPSNPGNTNPNSNPSLEEGGL
ncbi:serine protease [Phormidium pseudopriestleyi FRX01]|uniref:Serine protease n=1 Tax=Phormidium pseudopriestleyi FRX01 TaxID=1759528 RepID=A0ABS3FV47_9CYAN|nr:tetratricopeptide repeat-containing serine protease family protein [Phormidium pseudopriestleyi]MBO0351003.1 serine protease [Phormidium pseudopriestleyi FRX01]